MKGRNRKLIDLRDRKLIRRYYHLTEIDRLRFDDALRILSEDEFFISEERIMLIIREKAHLIDDIDLSPCRRKPKLTPGQRRIIRRNQ